MIDADCVLPDPAAIRRVRSADGTGLNVELYGPADGPVVVLAHGWTCSTPFWAPVVNRLAADHRVVAYDQRGHGRSDVPSGPAGYGTARLADDLEAVLADVLPAGGRAVLAGHSMGGMTIMAAADRGEVAARTAGALLISTGPADLVAELLVVPAAVRGVGLRRALHRAVLESKLPLGPVNGVSRALLKYATMGPATPAARVDACARIVHACPTSVRHGWAKVLGELDVTAGLARLTAPTAVVVGSRDRLTPPVHARRMAAALPDPQGLLELPGAGHMSPMERPAEVAAEIRRIVALTADTRADTQRSATA
ncbi:alpha/beta fold hydrolase [Kitasatospora sp. DSM 101779]|uniref:alpha/beta fold hydrolase n=1 Tax=Kitasatospora sp. DSM 101779 TaxID=2853165 RepID=UPI0021DB0BE0|nr:alpha/beta hydrolase [Kitasatospora sp. DSM 101779]MCU7821849.1 alpha/beta hydrolase [Kitasatospora sp. DSM 101779]